VTRLFAKRKKRKKVLAAAVGTQPVAHGLGKLPER